MRYRRFAVPALLVFAASLFAQQRSGVTARAKPEDYAAHVSAGGQTYAASVLSPDQVKHIFAADISKKYVVFEVACYPNSGAVDLHPDSFTVNAHDDKDPVRPADSVTVAAQIQHQNTPRQPSGNTQVYTEANVGYESGTDPYTGRRVHGVYGGGGAGVGHGDGGSSTGPADWPPPQNAEALERQLDDRGLPEGRFAHPVAGYLYFPIALLKKQSKAGYDLKYTGDNAGSAELTVPSKSH